VRILGERERERESLNDDCEVCGLVNLNEQRACALGV
jgi:hypothetical protein